MRQELYRSGQFIDEDDMDDDEIMNWNGRNLEVESDEEEERMSLGDEIRKSLTNAGVDQIMKNES